MEIMAFDFRPNYTCICDICNDTNLCIENCILSICTKKTGIIYFMYIVEQRIQKKQLFVVLYDEKPNWTVLNMATLIIANVYKKFCGNRYHTCTGLNK